MEGVLDPQPMTQETDSNVWDWLSSFTDDLIVTGGQLLGGGEVTGQQTNYNTYTDPATEAATDTTTWLIIGGVAAAILLIVFIAFRRKK
jgi:LPXTG-motif cell wall-anchored protein